MILMPEAAKAETSCCGSSGPAGDEGCSCRSTSKASTEISNPGSGKSAPWITGGVDTPAGIIPRVSTRLGIGDRLGHWKARWNMGRMHYAVSPGLYAVGNPDASAPVLVTANYKMSFDRLRQELGGHHLWILVLDTRGINVWCAAGKGTFGTEELIRRIGRVGLPELVNHRRLVLPQLGAPGVAAHEVMRATGFRVIYGPVRAADIPAFLAAGMKADPAMREVRFDLRDRLVLTPIELVGAVKPALLILALLAAVNLIRHSSWPVSRLASETRQSFLPFAGALLTGTILVPLLLPVIPGRALSWKGWLTGLVYTGIVLLYGGTAHGWLQAAAYLLLLPSIVSFLAMNFTGATTYTSLSGVIKEMKIALPAQIASAGLGILALAGAMLI